MSKLNSPKLWQLSALMTVAIALSGVALVRLGYLPAPKAWSQVLCLSGCVPETAKHRTPADNRFAEGKYLNTDQSIDTLLKDDFDPNQVSILIEKAKNRLTVFYQNEPLKSYPVVFGDPIGDKRREGDRKTPEGIFRIRDKYEHPAWSRFLWLDYPNPPAWREHFAAKLSGQLNWFLPAGGQVGIHGVPEGQDAIVDQGTNWTWGCPSLKNADVIEIYRIVPVGALVEIVP